MSDGRLIFDTEIDSKGFKQGLSKLETDASKNLKGIGDGFQKTGAAMTRFITKPAVGAAAALAGLTLSKGMTRLSNIDNAKAKLQGLGHSAESVQKIMDSALESVRGTAFGLDAAATTAASAVAAGIKPGKELTRYLKLTGDAASIAGISMDDMGSIFNRVAASGKLMSGELNMLQDRGIPVLALLAKQTGKSMAEVKEDMSAGKISTEMFLEAIESGMGGAALTMGQATLSAALDNLWAAIGRVGANFISAGESGKGVFSQLRDIVVDLTTALGPVEEKAKVWGETFGTVFNNIVSAVRNMPKGVLLGVFGSAAALGPVLKIVGAIIKSTIELRTFQAAAQGTSLAMGVMTGKISTGNVVLGTFGKLCISAKNNAVSLAKTVGTKLAGAYGTATAKLAAMGTTQSTVNTLYGTSNRHLYGQKSGLKAAASGVASYTKNLVASAVAHVTNTASAVADTVANSKFGKAVKIVAGGVARATTAVLRFAAAHALALGAAGLLIGGIVAMAVYMNKTGTSADEMADKITDFANRAADAITAFSEALPGMVQAFVDSFTANIDKFSGIVETLVPAIVQSMVSVIDALVTVLPTVIDSIANAIGLAFPLLVKAGVMLFTGLVQAITECIGPIVEAIPPLIQAIVDAIVVLTPAIVEAAITLFSALIDAVPVIVEAIAPMIPQLIEQLVQMIISLTPVLFNAAVTLFMALVRAIPQILAALIQAFPQIVAAVIAGFALVKAQVGAKMQEILGKVKEKIKSIITQFGFSGLVSKVTGVFNKVKNAIMKPIDTAKEKVSSALKKIKNMFPLSVGKIFSNIKLPHISFSGGKAPYGLLGKGSPPRPKIKWYAKGGVYDRASLIGVGEKGAEAIMPLDKFWSKMDALANSIMFGMNRIGGAVEEVAEKTVNGPRASSSVASFERARADRSVMSSAMMNGSMGNNEFAALLSALSNINITSELKCDSKTLAKETAPAFKDALNRLDVMNKRKLGYVNG